MPYYFADLHIHIGQSNNKPVKITASRSLTITSLLDYALNVKGLDIVGVVDCSSPPVISELESLINQGILYPIKNGGLLYRDNLLLIPGSEIEVKVGKGRGHFISFFPGIEQLKQFSNWLSHILTNVALSSQLLSTDLLNLNNQVNELNGLLLPAHAFTPFKSLLGSCISSFDELSEQNINFKTIELGLSADKFLAGYIPKIDTMTTLSNSDAHSMPKIGREYNRLFLNHLNFHEIKNVLLDNGTKIVNYGLHPQLGKYYRSFCNKCMKNISEYPPPVHTCPYCGSQKIVVGVLDRISWLADNCDINASNHPGGRFDNYIYQVPLSDLPGIGDSTYWTLIESIGSEMKVIHQSTYDELIQLVSPKIADLILKSRTGELSIVPGGGGYYGRVVT